MSKETLVFILGLTTLLTPFLGIPREWKTWVFVVSGALLMIAGYSLRRNAFFASLEHESGERRADVFVESAPAPKDEDRGHTPSENV